MNEVAVIGAGPNGLTAAALIARNGIPVTVYEANEYVGGAASTQPIDGSVARFDLGSAVHPMALRSPAFAELGVLDRVDFVVPELSFAHVLDRRSLYAWRDLDRSVGQLGGINGRAYQSLVGPLVRHIEELSDTLLHPLATLPRHVATLLRFGVGSVGGMMLKDLLSKCASDAAALYAGVCAHVAGGSRGISNAGAGLFLAATAHSTGWPLPIGGSQAISDALAETVRTHGGSIHTGAPISHLDQIPEKIVLSAVSAEATAALAGNRLYPRLRARLSGTNHSPGSCLVHLVCNSPIPWADETLNRTATVHLGGSAGQVGAQERATRTGYATKPFVIVSQPSIFDSSRAPEGKYVVWAYGHVPFGSTADTSREIIAMIEAAAPGFRDTIEEKYVVSAAGLEAQNASLIGGDITGGTMDLFGSLVRPRLGSDPWYLKTPGLYLASSSAAPGPAVHGMGGYLAAQSMLRREFGRENFNG